MKKVGTITAMTLYLTVPSTGSNSAEPVTSMSILHRCRFVFRVAIIACLSLGSSPIGSAFAQQGTSASVPASPAGRAVVALAPQTTATVDPALSSGGSDNPNIEVLYDRLMEPLYTDRFELGPGIATKWTVSPDGKTIEFKIRNGVKFHNGDILTPEDVVFTFQRVQRIGQPIAKAPLERFLEKIEAKGDSVIFHLKEPDWKFVPLLSLLYYAIVPKKYIERVGNDGFLKAPVGTGPFRFVGWAKQEFLEVEAVEGAFPPEAWCEASPLRNCPPRRRSRLAMVKTGEADLAQVSVTSVKTIEADLKIKLIRVPNVGGLRIFLFHQADPRNPFSKLEVRQALSLAIDREAIAQRIYRGYAQPVAVATYNPVQSDFPSWGRKAPAYDLEKAKQLSPRLVIREERGSSSLSITTSIRSCPSGPRSPR